VAPTHRRSRKRSRRTSGTTVLAVVALVVVAAAAVWGGMRLLSRPEPEEHAGPAKSAAGTSAVGGGTGTGTAAATETAAGTETASAEPSAPLSPVAYAWAKEYRTIAHGCGVVEGLPVTNTREAFYRSYGRGVRVVEIDLAFTRDGKLVARHDWSAARFAKYEQKVPPGGVPTLAQFKSSKIKGTFTPLAAVDIVALMRRFPDVWVMTDIKEGSVSAHTRAVKALLDAANNDPAIRDRIIVQLYGEGDLAPTRRLGIRNVLYTFYRLQTSVGRALDFAQDKGIRVVTVPKGNVTRALLAGAKKHGLIVATHTVNDESEAKRFHKMGVKLVYSDRLGP
jgi:glycerophosphoryl diester phosphodiesterase